MKIIKYIYIFIIIRFTHNSIVLNQKKNHIVPESNKLQIQFNRIGEPITIQSDNFVESAKSDLGQVDLKSPYQDKRVGLNPKSYYYPIQDVETPEELQKEKDHLQKKKIGHLTNKITEEMLQHDINYPTNLPEKNTMRAYNQMDELEEDLHSALDTTNGKEPILMDPKVLKTLVSYLEHLDYVHSKEFGQNLNKMPPKLPDHLRAEKRDYMDIGIDVEKREEDVEVLQAKVDELHKKLLDITDPITTDLENEEEVQDLENEQSDLKSEVDVENKIIVNENEGETIEDNIENINEAEKESKDMDQDMKMELDEEKKKLEAEETSLIENTRILDEIKKINERLEEIDEELAELEETGVKETLIKELKEEKETLESKKDLLITEGKVDKKLSSEDVQSLRIPKLGLAGAEAVEAEKDNNYTGSATKYESIPNLLVVLQNISGAYNTLFNDLPEKDEELPKDTLTQLKEGLLLYAKLRNFIIAVTVNRDDLIKDMKYVKDNLDSINLSHDETLGFYDLLDRYNELKLKGKLSDATFILKETELRNETDSFSEHIRNLAKNIDTIINLDDFIYKETDYLRKNMDDDATLDAIKKVDSTILLLPKLIDVKIEIDQLIEEMKTGFDNITNKRTSLTATLDDMEKVNLGTYSVTDADKNIVEGDMKLGILGLFTTLLLLF